MSGCTSCPATMCPYMGLEEQGSPWTGERDSECTSSCNWNHDGCIVVGDLTFDLLDGMSESEIEELVQQEWPACPKADSCQWQQQAGEDMPCPPRLAVMTNTNPERCLF